jgi:hypothetical protein
MIDALRTHFNAAFSDATYAALLADIERQFPGQLDFRVAETPVFVPRALGQKLIGTCEGIIDVLTAPDFKRRTEAAVPPHQRVPRENTHSSFLAIDFAVCRDAAGELEPQLIELQGFPSIFGFQSLVSELFRRHYPFIPDSVSNYFHVPDQAGYLAELRRVILGGEAPEHVVLLELFPERQKTRIDFAVTEHFLGVRPVCLTNIRREGRRLFYDRDGVPTEIRRIYNRLIFDELDQYPDLETAFRLTDEVDVTWVGHPNWFFPDFQVYPPVAA